MAEDRRPDGMKRVLLARWHEVGSVMVHLSPSGSRTLEPYESPSLLPRVGAAPAPEHVS